MQNYILAFGNAYQDYVSQSQRPGYLRGWFSRLRHSRNLYPHINQLFHDLRKAKNDEEAIRIFKRYLSSPKTKFNNHSFSIYLLKHLTQYYPHITWQDYYPKEKQIVFYNGIVYRGTLQPPSDALVNGISRLGSEKIDEFAQHTSMDVGISTSKSYNIAKFYQHSTFSTGNGAVSHQKGYLYKIDYRGIGGIDIGETLKKRGNRFIIAIGQDKQEVNIVGTIPACDIMGYWDTKQQYQENRAYLANKPTNQNLSFFARLEALFKKQVHHIPFAITLTDFQLEKALQNIHLRKLFDYLLKCTPQSNDANYTAALKLFGMLMGENIGLLTEQERLALRKGALGNIVDELDKENLIDASIKRHTYQYQLLHSEFAPLAKKLCQLAVQANSDKKEKIYGLLDHLLALEKYRDVEHFNQVKAYCSALLTDEKFTHKKIGFFGLIASDYQIMVKKVQDYLTKEFDYALLKRTSSISYKSQ